MKEEKDKEETTQDPADSYVGKMDEIVNFKRDKSLNIYQRIHEVMKEVWYVKKRASQGEYYATLEHDDVTNKVRPSLVKHGIVAVPKKMDIQDPVHIKKKKHDRNGNEYEQMEYFTQAEIFVKFVNIDNPKDYVVGVAYGHGIDSGGNAPGKAISYAFKYVVTKMFFLESGEKEDTDHLYETEPDENAAYIYNSIGEELFGEEWDKIGKKKVYQITGGKTSEASRAPRQQLNIAIRNLYELKKKKDEDPDKDIKDIEKEQEKETMNDVLKDFE